MDAVMQFLLQVVLLVILGGFLALMAAAASAVVWFGWHLLHDHWTVGQALRQARLRLYH
jgi:hypothetical protein